MPGPIRRVNPAQASKRASSNDRRVVERGSGYVSSSVSDTRDKKAPPYYEDSRELDNVLNAEFSESDPAAFIRVGAGLTINLHNFESLRIDCAVTIPCRRGELDAAYQLASDFVADKLSEEQTTWLGNPQFAKSTGKGR